MAKQKLGLSDLAQRKDTLPAVKGTNIDAPVLLECPRLKRSPLQELKYTDFKEIRDRQLPEPIFEKAIEAEQSAAPLYDYLSQRIESIADKTLKITFPWRLRVGGLPGFRELLLPAMHTVYGVPYVPASSLKGVVKEWAEQQDEAIRGQVQSMLGYLDMNAKEDASSLGKIQFLDAFPTGKCLSIDMANPQWHWPKKRGADGSFAVTYNPEPHALLSLQGATLTIGIKATRLGSEKDVEVMEKWVREALKHGLGSRISAGYGRARGQIAETQLSCEYPFQLWSQGMYGQSTTNPEFRTVAVRGVLRYWFRAVAMGLYDSETVKTLEGKIFGTIEPKAIRGGLRISIDATEMGVDPFRVVGTIRLEAISEEYLKFAQALLKLASGLSGCGRGSRRPLHWNSGRLRGCHWELSDAPIVMNSAIWQQMLENARSALRTVQQGYGELSPKEPKICRLEKRTQDVLNESAHIYLLKCGGMKHPKAVKDEEWRKIGDTYQVRGEGLQLLYSSRNYKGRSSDRDGLKPGNPNVGGAVNQEDGSIPSYVLIKSIIPHTGDPYQVITIFDVDGHDDRATFANAIKDKGGMKVWPPAP
jgi:CRISPR-associated protein Cmr6